jgi:DivIVA domain-containing protein
MDEKMDISPADIRHKEFKTNIVGGYDKKEVHEYLELLAEQFEELYSPRLTSSTEIQPVKPNELGQHQMALENIQRKEELIANTLVQAQQTREELIRVAKVEAKNIITEAELSAKKAYDETNNYLNNLKHEFINLKENHRQYLMSSHAQLKTILERLEQDPMFKKDSETRINEDFDNAKKMKPIVVENEE